MRIASWNINSVRLRVDGVRRLAEACAPDVICLQETKCPEEQFPTDALRSLGFPYCTMAGMKGLNGVAILSRVPFAADWRHNFCGREDARHIAVTLENGLRVHNCYFPAGGDDPDPQTNPKFAHKLAYLQEMKAFLRAQHKEQASESVLLGDFNIAPLPADVWSHRQLLDTVCHTPIETETLCALQEDLDWCDTARYFIPASEKHYTWWSYRNRDWRASNRGRRLDHIWVSPDLKPRLKQYGAIPDARDWEKPSDHVPCWLEISE